LISCAFGFAPAAQHEQLEEHLRQCVACAEEFIALADATGYWADHHEQLRQLQMLATGVVSDELASAVPAAVGRPDGRER
jgi:hypothetical protein